MLCIFIGRAVLVMAGLTPPAGMAIMNVAQLTMVRLPSSVRMITKRLAENSVAFILLLSLGKESRLPYSTVFTSGSCIKKSTNTSMTNYLGQHIMRTQQQHCMLLILCLHQLDRAPLRRDEQHAEH